MNCDRLARWYALAEHAAFGRALERRRVCFLSDAKAARCVLTLGDGDGRALVALLRACPKAEIEYMDLSPRMLRIAQQRAGTANRVQWAAADALHATFPASHYDLIVTHFFLDCLDDAQVRALAERLACAMQPGARWIVSEFRNDAFWSRVIVRALYWFFRMSTGLRITTLPNYREALRAKGFQMMKAESGLWGLVVSELWALP